MCYYPHQIKQSYFSNITIIISIIYFYLVIVLPIFQAFLDSMLQKEHIKLSKIIYNRNKLL